MRLTDAQINHMVDRFLQWRLPANFNPDAGISFTPEFNVEWNAKQGKPPQRHEPVGTNLFDAKQAKEMVGHMVEGLPSTDAYDQGRRDVLNAILALNPKTAQKLHILSGGTEDTFANHAGKLPFDVVFWVTEVASQLGIEPDEGV